MLATIKIVWYIYNLPVWGWAPCHGRQWEGCFWAVWSGPKLPQQSPETPPERGSGGHSSWHTFQEPEQESYMLSHHSPFMQAYKLHTQQPAYSQRQHDLLEVLIPNDSLLQSFDRISGPANKRLVLVEEEQRSRLKTLHLIAWLSHRPTMLKNQEKL